MTEQTEPGPYKWTIPPDLQRQVEDIQIKVPRAIGIQHMLCFINMSNDSYVVG